MATLNKDPENKEINKEFAYNYTPCQAVISDKRFVWLALFWFGNSYQMLFGQKILHATRNLIYPVATCTLVYIGVNLLCWSVLVLP